MAKKKDVRPFFPVKHEFLDSLEAFITATAKLHAAARAITDLKCITEPKVAQILQDALDNFDKASLSE